MPEEVKIDVGGDASAFEREMKRVQREVDRLKIKLAKVGQESRKGARDAKKMKTGFAGVAGPVKQIAGMLGVGGLVALGVRQVITGVEKWRTYMREIAASSKKAGQDMVAFALMQEKGTKGKHVRETAAWGAQYGMSVGESWGAVQALQAQYGSYKKGMAAAEHMGRLIQVGTPVESAKDVVSLAKGLGEGAGGFARQVYRTGEYSAKEVSLIAGKVGKGLPDWGGIKGGATSGLAGMAVLSEIYKEELGTMTKALSLSLTKKAPWKKMGYKGALGDPEAQFAFLQEKGILSTVQLEDVGFGEQKQRTTLSIVARKAERYKEAYREIGAVRGREGYLKKLRAETEEEVPEMRFARITGQLEKALTVQKTFGPEAMQAQIRDLNQLIYGMRLTLKGFGEYVGEGGRVRGWGIKAGIVDAYSKDLGYQEEFASRLQEAGLPGMEQVYRPGGKISGEVELKRLEILAQILIELQSTRMEKRNDKKRNDFTTPENRMDDE